MRCCSLRRRRPPRRRPAAEAEPKLPPEQLDSLVAPIALYPDPLLAQVLVASTYPLEIVQLQQWLEKNKDLKDKALTDAVAKQPWDPSIQAMAGLPDVVKRLADDIQWTTDLGNAFLAQQSDVMDAVQRMRKKAAGERRPEDERAAEGRDEGRRAEAGDRRPAGEPRGRLRSDLQPGRRLRPARLPYPPIYYPPPPPPGSLLLSFGVGMMVGGRVPRRLGLRLRLGPQRHQRQRQQQLQPQRQHQPQHQRQPQREHELEPQSRSTAAVRRTRTRRRRTSTAARRAGAPPRSRQASARAQSARASGAGASAQSAGSGARAGAAADRSGARSASRGVCPEQSRGRRRRRPDREPRRPEERRVERLERPRWRVPRLQRRECPGEQLEGRVERGLARRRRSRGGGSRRWRRAPEVAAMT